MKKMFFICFGSSPDGVSLKYPGLVLVALVALLVFGNPVHAMDMNAASSSQPHLQGVVLPAEQYKLGFRQAGPLTILPQEGQVVKQGDVLAQIDDAEKQLGLSKAKVALQAAKVQLEMAEHGYAKNKRLTGESVLSDMALKEAEFSVRQAKAMVAQARVDVESAKAALEGCRITAPVSGVVTKVAASMGEWAGPGQPILEMADLTALELTMDLPPQLAEALTVDTETEVQNEHGMRLGTATARNIVPYIDAASGLQRVVWTVRPDENAMLAGRYVNLAPWSENDKTAGR